MTVLSADKKGEKLDQGKQASDVGQMSKKQKRGKFKSQQIKKGMWTSSRPACRICRTIWEYKHFNLWYISKLENCVAGYFS